MNTDKYTWEFVMSFFMIMFLVGFVLLFAYVGVTCFGMVNSPTNTFLVVILGVILFFVEFSIWPDAISGDIGPLCSIENRTCLWFLFAYTIGSPAIFIIRPLSYYLTWLAMKFVWILYLKPEDVFKRSK